ncbi:60S ribosomal protein L9 [Tieghemiomyces parasiticus]|uniref:60S ribosomal protein L9 n=1 Tax=Tieghemiomyces parasiticus TaxID=78921 RepID=A0A9W8AGI2_9FUNG|nr:60S ribosomal protein L9 [Tieghemiomyces parasiticus]
MSVLLSNLLRIRAAPPLATGANAVPTRGIKYAKRIQIRLTKPVAKLGRAGQVVEVRPGYMRTNLYPKGLADYVPLYTGPRDRVKEAKAEPKVDKKKAAKEASVMAAIETTAALETRVRANALLTAKQIRVTRLATGAVTVDDVQAQVRKDLGFNLERECISLEPTESTDETQCTICFPNMGPIPLSVVVQAESASV